LIISVSLAPPDTLEDCDPSLEAVAQAIEFASAEAPCRASIAASASADDHDSIRLNA
jgi:hypothetical protein